MYQRLYQRSPSWRYCMERWYNRWYMKSRCTNECTNDRTNAPTIRIVGTWKERWYHFQYRDFSSTWEKCHPLSVRVVIEEVSIYADFQNNFTNEKFLYLEKFSNLETRKMNIFEHKMNNQFIGHTPPTTNERKHVILYCASKIFCSFHFLNYLTYMWLC